MSTEGGGGEGGVSSGRGGGRMGSHRKRQRIDAASVDRTAAGGVHDKGGDVAVGRPIQPRPD